MVGRALFAVILSMVLFAIVFLVVGFIALILTGNLERAALIGGVCGFAAAWLANTAYILGLRTRGETRSETGDDKEDWDNDAERRLE